MSIIKLTNEKKLSVTAWDVFHDAIIETINKGQIALENVKLYAKVGEKLKNDMYDDKNMICIFNHDETKCCILEPHILDAIKPNIAISHAQYLKNQYNPEKKEIQTLKAETEKRKEIFDKAEKEWKDYKESNAVVSKNKKWSETRHKNEAYRKIKKAFQIQSVRI